MGSKWIKETEFPVYVVSSFAILKKYTLSKNRLYTAAHDVTGF